MEINRTQMADIQSLLQQMKGIKDQLNNAPINDNNSVKDIAEDSVKVDFSSTLKQALENLSEIQSNAEEKRQAFVKGDPSVDIVDVTLAAQKSSVAFEGAVQIRNRLVNAYKEIMNMPI